MVSKVKVLMTFFREDKKLKLDEVKKYLVDQEIVFGDSESKLKLTSVVSISGEASIAVVRGEPRFGHELTLKLELTGIEYLQDFVCEVELTELCDDGPEPESVKVDMKKMLDTNQAIVAKDIMNYNDDCSKLCVLIHKALKDYPKNMSQ
jgi:hypothetical protein